MKTLMVTGTRRGMTERQKDMLATMLAVCRVKGFDTFLDGDCVGADVEAVRMALNHDFHCIGHPSTARTRAFYKGRHETREPAPPLVRNRTMVDASDLVVGCPGESYEVLRSGTWACLRYTGKVKRRTIIIWPDGQIGLYVEGYGNVPGKT